jgi:hypothetical protein
MSPETKIFMRGFSNKWLVGGILDILMSYFDNNRYNALDGMVFV